MYSPLGHSASLRYLLLSIHGAIEWRNEPTEDETLNIFNILIVVDVQYWVESTHQLV